VSGYNEKLKYAKYFIEITTLIHKCIVENEIQDAVYVIEKINLTFKDFFHPCNYF